MMANEDVHQMCGNEKTKSLRHISYHSCNKSLLWFANRFCKRLLIVQHLLKIINVDIFCLDSYTENIGLMNPIPIFLLLSEIGTVGQFMQHITV